MPADHPPPISYRSRIPTRIEPHWGWPLVQTGAVLFAALALVGWGIAIKLGPMAAIDTHFASHPEQYSEFFLGPWRIDPLHPKDSDGSTRFVRDATATTMFFNLRYVQPEIVYADGKTEIRAVEEYYAELRWTLHATAIGVISLGIIAFWFAKSRSRHLSARRFP